MDPRIKKLAHMLIHYSVDLQKGERVLIQAGSGKYAEEMVTALVDEAYAVGALPFVEMPRPTAVNRRLFKHGSAEQYELMAKWDLLRMQEMNAWIAFGQPANLHNMKDIPQENMRAYGEKYARPVHLEQRVKHTKWVGLGWPNDSFAQSAEMPTELFEDFYFDVCSLDYAKMDRAMEPLKKLMENTDKVRLVAPGTDLSFSIKGIGAVKCAGQKNIPDGECYSAPVRESVNGMISFNTTSLYEGFLFKDIRFEFRNGKIVEATANDTERLNKILDTDEGARYVGEFSLGFNPFILKPMNDVLFDEKIAGSLHFTPGQCYDEAYNGNKSNVHWDLVLIQRPEFGGGEIYFDDRLIRKDGIFVAPELTGLNPEHLKS